MFVAHFHDEKKNTLTISKHRRKIKYYFSKEYIKSVLRETHSIDDFIHIFILVFAERWIPAY